MTVIRTKPSFSVRIEQSDVGIVQQFDIRIRQLLLCSFSSLRWVEVQGVEVIDFLINRSFRRGQHGRAHCLALLSARLQVPCLSAQQR